MIDLKTISVVVSFEMLFFGLIVVSLNRRHNYAGVDAIGAGMALSFLAGILMSLQGVAHSIFSIVGFGAFTIASMSLINHGFRVFLEIPSRPALYYAATAVTFLYCYYFSEIKSDYLARVIYFSVMYFIIFFDNFRLLFFEFKPEINNICRFTGVIFLFLSLLYASRGFFVYYFPEMRANFVMDTAAGLGAHYYLSLATVVLTLVSLFFTFVCVIFMMTFRLQAELQAKTERLAELNGDRERFLSIIAHDLISPVSSIPGIVRLLIEGYDSFSADKIKSFLDTIYSASARVNSLLENLMTWSRASTGRMPFNPAERGLREIFDVAVKFFEDPAGKKSLSVANRVPEDLKAYCDADMVHTIARNLIANAVKYCAKGGSIEIGGAAASGGSAVFFVRDDGAGMGPDTLGKLFKAGERVGEAVDGCEKGNGIGLLIVKELVDKHGGKISVESARDKGSLFTVEFPPAPSL